MILYYIKNIIWYNIVLYYILLYYIVLYDIILYHMICIKRCVYIYIYIPQVFPDFLQDISQFYHVFLNKNSIHWWLQNQPGPAAWSRDLRLGLRCPGITMDELGYRSYIWSHWDLWGYKTLKTIPCVFQWYFKNY